MPSQGHQLRLDLGDQPLWSQLDEETRRRCLALLSQLLQEIWRLELTPEEEKNHEREDHTIAS